ncbi:cyclic nucleotide-binding domain-containing protein [Thermodesulfobacteriota bacterium]
MPANDLIVSLRDSKIFNGLSDNELETASAYGSVEKYEPNRILIHEGEIGTVLYIILKGTAEVFLPKKSDFSNAARATRIKLGRLDQGDCMGEYSVIDNNPASASVVTLGECTLFTLPKANFEEIINLNDHFAKQIYRNMLNVLIKRSRDADKELDLCFII